MEIQRVVPSGYCKGVINAIKIAKDTRIIYPNDDIYVLGMIVHNSFVINELSQLGIITLDDSNTTKEDLLDTIEQGVVIFTAHGISDKIKNKALDKGLICIDATCSDVLKTKEILIKYLIDEYDVIYFGKKKHPEAEAILSIDKHIHLITNKEDIFNLNINNKKIFMTNQTTMSSLELEEYIKLVKQKYPNCIIQKEICNATSSRQLAILNLKDIDLLYVVGDEKSNNTNKLVEIGQKSSIKQVKLISNYKDINDSDLININKIAVTAGASTPPILIDEVINYLKLK